MVDIGVDRFFRRLASICTISWKFLSSCRHDVKKERMKPIISNNILPHRMTKLGSFFRKSLHHRVLRPSITHRKWTFCIEPHLCIGIKGLGQTSSSFHKSLHHSFINFCGKFLEAAKLKLQNRHFFVTTVYSDEY
ncbi:hypothetical protein K1719_032888 [Acacia pycnantha]|nr:hypothetical protein K1719_032888 [Acacia pycnantha]